MYLYPTKEKNLAKSLIVGTGLAPSSPRYPRPRPISPSSPQCLCLLSSNSYLAFALGLCIHQSKLYNGAANIILVPRNASFRWNDLPWELEACHYILMLGV